MGTEPAQYWPDGRMSLAELQILILYQQMLWKIPIKIPSYMK